MGVETFPAITTRRDAVVAWGQENSLRPMPFGTACCASELMGLTSVCSRSRSFSTPVAQGAPDRARTTGPMVWPAPPKVLTPPSTRVPGPDLMMP